MTTTQSTEFFHSNQSEEDVGHLIPALDGGVPSRPDESLAASRHISSSTAKGRSKDRSTVSHP